MKNENVSPKYRVLHVDVTPFTDKEYRDENGIEYVHSLYLVNENEHTFICSATPNYCGYFMRYEIEFTHDSEEIIERVDEEATRWEANETEYFNARDVDAQRGYQWGSDVDESEIDPDDIWESALELNCNGVI